MNRIGLITISLLAGACGTISESELDEQAAAEGADGKADSVAGLVRLERATPTQVTTSFTEVRGAELNECFAAYKSRIDSAATTLSAAVTAKFSAIASQTHNAACADWSDLGEIVKGVLDMQGVTEATPADIIAGMPGWAKPQLTAASVGGYVQVDEWKPGLFYYDVMRVRTANAIAREKDPTGIDLLAIREQWKQVRAHTTLDRAYLNPVTFAAGALDGSDIFKNLRAAFPVRRLSLTSSGYTAISDFTAAGEGPAGDPAFAPIATALRKTSIRKRFYYSGGGEFNGDPWSSNVLIVVDEHGQAWGMQMGYSE